MRCSVHYLYKNLTTTSTWNTNANNTHSSFQIASSKWKTLLGILSGQIPQNMSEKRRFKLKISAHAGKTHRYLWQLKGPEVRRRLATYTSVMFVRHPLERLVSGYKDKFRPTRQMRRAKWQLKTSLEILAHYQHREPWQVAEDGPPTVTFEQFARWVADAPPPNPNVSYQGGPNDAHWRPVTMICLPCTVPYTVIGTLDTMDRDAPLVLKLANVTSVSFPTGFRSSTPSIASGLLRSLTPETMRRVLKHYLQDFLLFGYRPEDVFRDNTTAANDVRAVFDQLMAEV